MSNVLATPASPHYGLNQVRGEASALKPACIAAGRKAGCCGSGQRGVPAGDLAVSRAPGGQARVTPKRSLLLFQRPVVLTDETADLLRYPQELFPLLAIERNGKASEPVNGEPALLADFHGNLAPSGLLEGLILSAQSFNFSFQFFFRCHGSVIAQRSPSGRTRRAVAPQAGFVDERTAGAEPEIVSSCLLPNQMSTPNQTRRLADRNLNRIPLKMNHRTEVINIRDEIQIHRKVGV